MEFKKISVFGLGYIGLPTAAVIASRGIDVVGIDVSEQAVKTINAGKIHIVEPDLDIVVKAVVSMGKLRATLVPESADAFMIAVPTPFDAEHKPDLSYIEASAKAIGPVLEKGNLVILESTSPVGATEKLAEWLAQARPDLTFPQQHPDSIDVNIAHCPERVLPGHVLHELVSNDRIIGGLSDECALKAQALYEIFVKGECILTNSRTAELSKLTENAFRDVNIAFANELSMICDHLKINPWNLITLANRHPRVNILSPGPGVGGHCIAVDPWFIVDSAPEQAKLIKTARLVNDAKPHHVLNKIKAVADQFKRPVVLCMGLAFKADIDDLRESPAVEIVEALVAENVGTILAVEPNIKALPEQLAAKGVELVGLEEGLERANVLLVLVGHKPFKLLRQEHFMSKAMVDTCGLCGML